MVAKHLPCLSGALRSGSGVPMSHHDCFALPAPWVRLAVGPYQAVDVELGVMHRVPKVASIAPGLYSLAVRILNFVQQALIHPIPDESSLRAATDSDC